MDKCQFIYINLLEFMFFPFKRRQIEDDGKKLFSSLNNSYLLLWSLCFCSSNRMRPSFPNSLVGKQQNDEKKRVVTSQRLTQSGEGTEVC